MPMTCLLARIQMGARSSYASEHQTRDNPGRIGSRGAGSSWLWRFRTLRAEKVESSDYLGLVRIAFQCALVKSNRTFRPLHRLIDSRQLDQHPRLMRIQFERLLQTRLRPR